MTRDDLKLVLQFFFDFAITAGSILGGAMLEKGAAQMPHQAVLLLALIVGFVTAARRAQATLEGRPREDLDQTVKQLVAQMRTVQVATAQAQPVTPLRVDDPQPKPVKDSS